MHYRFQIPKYWLDFACFRNFLKFVYSSNFGYILQILGYPIFVSGRFYKYLKSLGHNTRIYPQHITINHTTFFTISPLSPVGCSVKAVSSDGRLLGVRLNGLLTRAEYSEEPADSQQEVEECTHPRFRKILRLLKRVYWESNVFTRFPEAQRVLEIRITSVDEAYRCLGIAQAFTERTK